MTTPSTESRSARRQRRLREPDILNDPAGNGDKRQYIRITPQMEGEVLAVKHRLGIAATHDAIAQEVGLPTRTVRYILTEMPFLKRGKEGEAPVAASLKDRIYDVISTVLVIRDVAQLRELLGMADPEHDVVHVLHSLHTQGRIDFDERGNKQGTATYVNIRMPKKGGPKKTDALTEKAAAAVIPDIDFPTPAEEPVVEEPAQSPIEPPSQPAPEVEEYPLLKALAEREWRRLDGDSKANAYINAAAQIEQIDPAMAADLMAKAEALADPYPSPLEAEYLRYATDHIPPPVKENR